MGSFENYTGNITRLFPSFSWGITDALDQSSVGEKKLMDYNSLNY